MKIRGVIVGEVLGFDSNAEGAKLTLGIYPSQVDTIPENVTGSIVPKTLFGEKYVSLEVPDDPSPQHIETGDTIKRTEVAVEVEKVLSDLYPLLRTVQPAEINQTLNALATALEGRGEQIGENLETVDSYLKRINPQIPDIVEDLRLTSQVSDTYSSVMPQIARILRNTVKTTGTLEDRQAKLNALFTDVTAFSDTARGFLQANGDNLIRLGQVSAAQLRVLAKYAPEFPCLTKGIVNAGKLQAEAFRGFTLHIVLETLPNQPRATTPTTSRGSPTTAVPTACTCRTRRGRSRTPCGTSRTSTTASTSPPARAPAGSPRTTTAPAGRQPSGVGLAQVTARSLARPDRRRRARPGGPARGPDGPWGGGVAAMKMLDRRTASDLTKLLIFILVTTLATGVLVITIGNLTFGGSKQYKAEFVDATGVVKGDDVRIAGVKVGTVKNIEIVDRTRAMVTFSVQDQTSLSKATHAAIRYRNLVGQRYISLTQEIGDGAALPEGATIPVSQTSPALDLTVLFNGFKPLFQALSPSDINKLSYEIVQVFQGEGGTLEGLLAHTASVTSTLADRDKVIGSLIDNLNDVLDHIGDRDDQLNQLITTFRAFVGGLKDDRQAILGSLDQISELSVQTADLVSGIREPFVDDIKQLRSVATTLDANKSELDRALQVLPIKLNKVGRTAIYGSWFNFYLCQFKGKVTIPGAGDLNVNYPPQGVKVADRCDLGGNG